MFCEPIDKQTQDYTPASRDDPFRLLEEDREGQKERILEKTEATLHTALLFVGGHQFLVGKLCRVEHIGRDDEAGPTRTSCATRS